MKAHPGNPTCGTLGLAWLAMACIVGVPTETAGQAQNRVGYVALDPATALERLANGTLNSGVIIAAFDEDRIVGTTRHVGNRDRYSDAQRRELLDGVERIATAGSPARTTAFSILAGIGLGRWDTAPEAREIPGRLLRIYDQTESRSSRGLALRRLGQLLAFSPPEASQIIDLLVEVASSPQDPTVPLPGSAVEALLGACEVGVPVLQRLVEENLIVAEPLTAIYVRDLVAAGISREDMERGRARPCP